MNDTQISSKPRYGIFIVFGIVIAFALGAWVSGEFLAKNISKTLPGQFIKFKEAVFLINEAYVDEPDIHLMVEGAIQGMLEKLDPHSVYIAPAEQSVVEERFAGEFSGIGIQFDIRNEILTVVSPIPGTPADRMGLRAGDKIVEIEGESALGITNEQVRSKLRGKTGTKVNITVQRNGLGKPFDVELTRGKIPIHSVEASFILNDRKTGYIMISQFTAVTEKEFELALRDLEKQGMEQLILDLRGNSGGYRGQAREVADRFIESGKIITTTKGRARGASDTLWASSRVTRDMPLIVLVSNGSASASEIVAGAIQDHDRGLILGQPTFGKGLVQLPFEMNDGSVVRITISRWHTPSGRCVQRPYDEGIGEYYAHAFRDGNSEEVDTVSQEYYTRTGRVVYGESGIQPDVLIDSGVLSEYGSALLRQRVLFNWSQDHADSLGNAMMSFDDFKNNWTPSREEIDAFINYADSKGIKFDKDGWEKDKNYLITQIKGEMAQRLYNGRNFLWEVLINGDSVVDSALVRMGEAKSLKERPSL